ncbi:hypothetical protein DPMN_101400 [Dreissena polymorpha]|uniref:Uncharacterized protein n=1 Tax=Dreissena polymorpha TaxID=45954 RepID=A0A9D4LIW3_DREPO|nr:hypothetical protein DPMN_101400 [Dreissena polymorpha]
MEMVVAGCSYETDYGHKGKQVSRKRKPVPKMEQHSLLKEREVRPRKKKSKSKQVEPEGDDSEQCPVCGIFCRNGEDAICCDSCLRWWFHRTCVYLRENEDWDYFSSSDAVYTCPLGQ